MSYIKLSFATFLRWFPDLHPLSLLSSGKVAVPCIPKSVGRLVMWRKDLKRQMLFSAFLFLILVVSGIMYWGQPVFQKSCVGRLLKSDDDAIQRAYSFWSTAESENKKWPYFKSPHYQHAVELLDDSKKEKYLRASKKWVWLKLSYQWEVHAEVFKWYPSYYDLFVVFDGCGNEIKHGGV